MDQNFTSLEILNLKQRCGARWTNISKVKIKVSGATRSPGAREQKPGRAV